MTNILVAEPKIYFDPSYSHVPEEMKQVDQWLAFLITWNPETEHFDKTPLSSSGRVTNDHQGGESFATMLEYTKRNANTVLGFYVRPPFVAIDMDDAVNMEIKDIATWAQEIIRETGSYTELSPSGTGLHIIGLGTKPGNKSKIGSVEIYTDKRALTVTSCPIEGYENLNQVDITSTYDKMVSRAYVFGESKHERVLNERASSREANRLHHGGGAITSLLTLLATGDYTANTKPFVVTDKYGNWAEYPSQSEAVGSFLVCAAYKYDCNKEEMEQAYIDSHLSDIPKWANGKWERLGKDEIQTAINLVSKPQQAPAKEQPAAPSSPTLQAASAATASAPESVSWAEPRPFEALLSPVPPFKIEYLPESFRPWALDVAERMSVPLDYVGICMLCTFSSVIGRRAFVYPKGTDKEWKEAINLAGAVVASSGTMKTPTWKVSVNEVNAIEKHWREEHALLRDAYDQAYAQYKENNRGKKKSLWEGAEPQPPEACRRLVINDATPETTLELMKEFPEGLLLYRDEIGGWLAELDKPGRESQRQMFLQAMNGNDHHAEDRIGRGYTGAVMCLGFFGGMQPKIAIDFANDERNAEDGTIARLGLFSWPDPPTEVAIVDRTANLAAKMRFRHALSAVAPLHEKSIRLDFAESAQTLFLDWLREHSNRLLTLKGPFCSHLGKYRGLLPRVAALYHLADVASAAGATAKEYEKREVSADSETNIAGQHLIERPHLERAIAFLSEYLESHASRLYGCVRSINQRAEHVLMEHMRAGELKDGFTAREVVRKGWQFLLKTEDVKNTLDAFVDMGWIRPMPRPAGQVGQPTDRYEINPAVKAGK